MSYSQKHSGKVLVPWFNRVEWRLVYTLLSTGTKNSYKEALRIMKIWKIRTPLLSAGIEGTMQVLEGLLSSELNCEPDKLMCLRGAYLLRFLNACAASGDKQGTFNKTAKKIGMPERLINFRHNFCHEFRNLRSESYLQDELEMSLKWLMENYWMVQYEKLPECVVVSADRKVFDTLRTYIKLKQDLFRNMNAYDEAFLSKLKSLVPKRINKSETDISAFINTLEANLKQTLKNPENRNSGPEIAQILTSDNGLLLTNLEPIEGDVQIPRNFRELWSNLLNIIFESGFLFHLLRKLLEVTNNTELENISRQTASLWITEIYDGLIKLQAITDELESIKQRNSVELDSRTSQIILKTVLTQKNPAYEDCIEFEIIDKLPYIESRSFEEDVLRTPNRYTEVFLERVMKFNKNTEEYIEDTKHLVESFLTNKGSDVRNEVILTVHDLCSALNLDESEFNDLDGPQSGSLLENTAPNANIEKRRWYRIKDVPSAEELPYGIWPNQNREDIPVLFRRDVEGI